MKDQQSKDELLASVTRMIENIQRTLPNSTQLSKLQDLYADIEQDYYTIVVVGEFKHGKSTFVNALLGQDIMPVDVTPTTATINAVFYDGNPQVEIVKTNGSIENRPLTADVLNQYTAAAEFDPDQIKYLKLFLPIPLLEKRVVLVDTPGVNDLNQHRSDITFQFIPRADVILFMLDMTAPMKRSEQEFLKKYLMGQGTEKIIYVANFLDRVNEEEIDEILELIQKRLEQITRQATPMVYPVSALEAFEGKIQQQEEKLAFSGLPEIEDRIQGLIHNGARGKEKLTHFYQHFQFILEQIQKEVETAEVLSKESTEALISQTAVIQNWLSQQAVWEGQIQEYIGKREDDIRFMVRKSITFFGDKLREDITQRIQLFQGPGIKSFIESQLPLIIRTQFTQWIDQYADYIHELLTKLEKEISQGLSDVFKQSVSIHAYQGERIGIPTELPIFTPSVGNTNVKAGLVVGGISTVAMLLGGSFIIPVVGMAGLPMIQQWMAEKQVETIKPEILTHALQHIDSLLDQFQLHLDRYISKAVYDIKEQALLEFIRLLQYVKSVINEEIEIKNQQAIHEASYQDQLHGLMQMLKGYEKDMKERI
jgi:GTPase Era involved in 16S rRNA processing